MLRKNLIHQILKLREHYLWAKKIVIGLMKDGLDGKIMKEIVGLRPETYRYLTDDDHVYKRVKCVKTCVIKWKVKIESNS